MSDYSVRGRSPSVHREKWVAPNVLSGKPCIRGMRISVGTILGLLAAGHSEERILEAYPYLDAEDIRAALSYAARNLA